VYPNIYYNNHANNPKNQQHAEFTCFSLRKKTVTIKKLGEQMRTGYFLSKHQVSDWLLFTQPKKPNKHKYESATRQLPFRNGSDEEQ